VPTARELLDQADALMRRNRARAEDDIPLLTDAVPSAQEAQSQFAPARRPAVTPVGDADDDVPLLTDEVEEIEAAAIDAEVGEGEPSAWLDFEEAEPSVIGDAPDSIAIVPPVDLRRPAPAPDVDEAEDAGELDEIDEDLAAAIAAAPREEESLRPAVVEPAALPSRPAPPETPARAPVVIAGGAAALLTGGPPGESQDVAPIATVPAPLVLALPETPPSPAETPVPRDDAAHWEAMAEEIRMQVLQRIDLFTDTGLRTQLGARLQPIVDRASADLVATINQHVGELLRAYVAEAIEREIDSWRRNH
jgi:hypothetical protein